jgi:hypothetical protein
MREEQSVELLRMCKGRRKARHAKVEGPAVQEMKMVSWIYAVPKHGPKRKKKTGSKKKRKSRSSKSVWSVSGGLPSLGKRAR